jgi:hypothetical protein
MVSFRRAAEAQRPLRLRGVFGFLHYFKDQRGALSLEERLPAVILAVSRLPDC